MIYLDHNATTPLLPEVVEAMLPYLTTHFGNPSSAHAYGRAAKEAVEKARAQVASLVSGASANDVIFTSGGTEATALALKGTLPLGESGGVRERLVSTNVEHPATARVLDALERSGHEVIRLKVKTNGLLDLAQVDASLAPFPGGAAGLKPSARWLSVIHAHNETGVLQPLDALHRLTQKHGTLLHADASQSAGKVALALADCDLVTLAAHKLYGPKGVGALIKRSDVTLHAQQLGAGHERGLRAGTENVASIVGFGAACVAAVRDLEANARKLLALRERLETKLRSEIPGLVIAAERSPRLPNTTYALFPGVTGNALLSRASLLAASTGSACHDGHDEAPAVLLALGVDARLAVGAVRLTTGRHTEEADIDASVANLRDAWAFLKR
ncbi:MAG: cysteine desulfurase [Archangium sp.]|nr:cysteine desulfurase [Archangium sp.]